MFPLAEEQLDVLRRHPDLYFQVAGEPPAFGDRIEGERLNLGRHPRVAASIEKFVDEDVPDQ